MERILNKNKKSRVISLMAFILAALMVITLLPISVKAENDPETIHLSNAILAQAKSNPNTPMNGIEYFEADEDMEGNGYYMLYEATTYILDESITLDGEVLLFRTDSDRSKPYETVIFNLNGFTVNQTNYLREKTSSNYDDYDDDDYDYEEYMYYGAVTCSECRLVITDESSLNPGVIDTTNIPKDPSGFDNPERIAVLAYGSVVIESGSFKGTIKTADAVYYSDKVPDVDQLINLIINGGHFEKDVISDAKTIITDGLFDGPVDLYYDSVIEDGVFKGPFYSYSDLLINDGLFQSYSYFDSEDGFGEVVINGGRFATGTEDDYDAVIYVKDVRLTINDIDVENLNEDPDGEANALYANTTEGYTSSIVINDGNFRSGESSFAVLLNEVCYAEINGGYFSGYDGGLAIYSENTPNVHISGGEFETFGDSGKYLCGAISYVFPKTVAKESYGNDALEFLLAKGYCYSPAPQVNYTGIREGWRDCVLYTQKSIEVKALPKVINDEGNTSLMDAVQELIKEILYGQSPVGVSPELAEAILAAANDGLDIDVSMTVTPITKDDIKEDAAKVEAAMDGNTKLVGFYDIKVGVSIDGELKGYITKFNDGVLTKVPAPENLPAVADGYERVFSFIRVHDGLAAKLPATLADGFVSGYSDSYSTYALVYEDVSSTPQTGDYGVTSWIVVAAGFLAAGVLIVIYKNKKEISE